MLINFRLNTERDAVSTTKPMTTADRQERYVKRNGRQVLTPRQQRQIRKTALRLEHGRNRKPVNRPSGRRSGFC
jgi:hypothetical protein